MWLLKTLYLPVVSFFLAWSFGHAQSADVVACRDDQSASSALELMEVARCHRILFNYASQQGYIEDAPGWLSGGFRLKSGSFKVLSKVCAVGVGGGGQIGGGGVVANCYCDEAKKDAPRHFSGNLIRVTHFRITDAGKALLGNGGFIFDRVEQISIPNKCPIHGTASQVRQKVQRVIDTGSYSCAQWPDDTGISQVVKCFDAATLRASSVVGQHFQGESLDVLKKMLRAE